MASLPTLKITVDTSEFDRAIGNALKRVSAEIRQPSIDTSTVGIAAAGLIVAGSTRAKISRRSLLGFGLFRRAASVKD